VSTHQQPPAGVAHPERHPVPARSWFDPPALDPPSLEPPSLLVRGLWKNFGAVTAIADVDLHVGRGEVVALLGDNGAGKSTVIKILAGIIRPDRGSVEVDGSLVDIDSPAVARSLGIAAVFQDLALCENLDVVENLFLGRERRPLWTDWSTMERQSEQLLRQLGSTISQLHAPVSTLSGGQRQTVAIARTLLSDPTIVMLDEPTAALSITQRLIVLELINRLRSRGIGVLIISHNIDDIGAVADRIVVLRQGRNNGVFDTAKVTFDELRTAMSGTAAHGGLARQAYGNHAADAGTRMP
jgi:D-xylose transport system ATP-binding protein